MITLKNFSLFNQILDKSEVITFNRFAQTTGSSVIFVILKADTQDIIDLTCTLERENFGQSFFNHKMEKGIISIKALENSAFKLSIFVSEEFMVKEKIISLVQQYNPPKLINSNNDNCEVKTIDLKIIDNPDLEGFPSSEQLGENHE